MELMSRLREHCLRLLLNVLVLFYEISKKKFEKYTKSFPFFQKKQKTKP